MPDRRAGLMHRERTCCVRGQYPAREVRWAFSLRGDSHAQTAAAKLAHLFCGLSSGHFGRFAFSGGLGEAIGAGTRQSLLGETRSDRRAVDSLGIR
jgi:hypothetical protein